jgi:hypothetical protein
MAGSNAVVHVVRPVSLAEDAQQSNPRLTIIRNPGNTGSFGPAHRKTPKTVWRLGRWRSASNEPRSGSDRANLHTILPHIF